MKSAQLGLGTVQFGTEYGIANSQGKPDINEVNAILSDAQAVGVSLLDTASFYGDSEAILGQCDLTGFNIVTKTPRFNEPFIKTRHIDALNRAFDDSLSQLNQESLYGLLCHHAPDLLVENGESLWQAMRLLKENGKVKKIGASIYKGTEIDQLMEHYPLDIVQLPLNIFDQRLIEGGHLKKLKQKGIEVHVRSVFLQGLLLMDDTPAYFKPIEDYLSRWQSAVEDKCVTKTQAALSFVKQVKGVDVVLIGVLNQSQLQECVTYFNDRKIFSGNGLACNIDKFVDPSLWVLNGD